MAPGRPAADECVARSQTLGERRLVFRHATRSRDTPMFEPEKAGELGQKLELAEGSVTGARRGAATERRTCRSAWLWPRGAWSCPGVREVGRSTAFAEATAVRHSFSDGGTPRRDGQDGGHKRAVPS